MNLRKQPVSSRLQQRLSEQPKTGVTTGEVTGEVQKLVMVLAGEMKRMDIQKAMALRHEDYFRETYLVPALAAGVIEMTIPDKPRSSKQKYRLTVKGRSLLDSLKKEGR